MDKIERFYCERCGKCCRNLRMSSLYVNMDRGDGVCKYYDEVSRLCNIYENRPIICNVDAYYDAYLRCKMTRKEYYDRNRKICEKLMNNEE